MSEERTRKRWSELSDHDRSLVIRILKGQRAEAIHLSSVIGADFYKAIGREVGPEQQKIMIDTALHAQDVIDAALERLGEPV